jgi:hypothetical protein
MLGFDVALATRRDETRPDRFSPHLSTQGSRHAVMSCSVLGCGLDCNIAHPARRRARGLGCHAAGGSSANCWQRVPQRWRGYEPPTESKFDGLIGGAVLPMKRGDG